MGGAASRYRQTPRDENRRRNADRLGRPGADRPAEERNIKLFLEKCNEVKDMPKAGMRRPDPKDPHGTESNHKTHLPKNEAPPVPEIQGKEKHGKKSETPR